MQNDSPCKPSGQHLSLREQEMAPPPPQGAPGTTPAPAIPRPRRSCGASSRRPAAVADQREKLSRAVKKGKGIAKDLEETAKELEGTKRALEEARQAPEAAEAATPPPPDTAAAENRALPAERKARAEAESEAPTRLRKPRGGCSRGRGGRESLGGGCGAREGEGWG